MKWTHEPGEAFPVLALNQEEVKRLAGILEQHARNKVQRMYEKYKDIHDSGEATDKQNDLQFKYEEQLNLIENFLDYTEQ